MLAAPGGNAISKDLSADLQHAVRQIVSTSGLNLLDGCQQFRGFNFSQWDRLPRSGVDIDLAGDASTSVRMMRYPGMHLLGMPFIGDDLEGVGRRQSSDFVLGRFAFGRRVEIALQLLAMLFALGSRVLESDKGIHA